MFGLLLRRPDEPGPLVVFRFCGRPTYEGTGESVSTDTFTLSRVVHDSKLVVGVGFDGTELDPKACDVTIRMSSSCASTLLDVGGVDVISSFSASIGLSVVCAGANK